ncbi:MAG: NAD(P)-dependent oxidoreductase [Desulfuromusa sp.]|nr:NAD(P)-dependent oxidoreductase [Desulfuromusa sp.]
MENKQDVEQIACVTGGTGMVGSRIVKRLLNSGYKVRVLSRDNCFGDNRVDLFCGSLGDEAVVQRFISDAHLLFHCAAELHDESKMWEVNVRGTKRLFDLIEKSSIEYFCYLSSAGVVGKTNVKMVDENSECRPQTAYEKSKWAAEKIVSQGIDGCSMVILRPTNVVDEKKTGALSLPINNTLVSKLKVFVKGGEASHIVHAADVADVALYFASKTDISTECFFVSCDKDPLNTNAGLWALHEAVKNDQPIDNVRPVPHLPLIVPYLMRKIFRGCSNRGDVRYSAEKLVGAGFKFTVGVEGAVRKVVKYSNSVRP